MIRTKEIYLQQSEPMQEEQYYQQFNPYTEMKLNLKRPIVFIDLETTGPDVKKDKIVEIAIIKLHPDLTKEQLVKRINPGIAIPLSATAVHGISNETVKDDPKFTHVSHIIYDFIKDCDVAGYNSNRFDIPLLFREFEYAGIFWDHNSFDMIDVCNLYKIKESRDLSAAYRFYCGKELQGAHGALADIEATMEVFLAQMEHYNDLPNDVPALSIVSNYGKAVVDLSGNFYMDEQGYIRINIGNKKDRRADFEPEFLNWMLYKADFPHDTRVVCAKLLGKPVPSMLPHQ